MNIKETLENLKKIYISLSDKIILKGIVQEIHIGDKFEIDTNYAKGIFEVTGIMENGDSYDIWFKNGNKPSQVAKITDCKLIKS